MVRRWIFAVIFRDPPKESVQVQPSIPHGLLPRIYLYVNCIVKGDRGSVRSRRTKYKWNEFGERGKNTRKDDRVTPISAGPSTRRMREKGEKGQLCHQKFQMGPPVPVCYPVPVSPFEIGRFFEPFFPTRHLWSRLSSVSFLPLFDSRLVFASCVSPPFRGGTFVKEGLPPLFRERTPPLIFRDDRSVAAFLIVQHPPVLLQVFSKLWNVIYR